MKINPVFHENVKILEHTKAARISSAVILAASAGILMALLPASAGNVLSPGYSLPDLFSVSVHTGHIAGALGVLGCLTVIIFRSEPMTEWMRPEGISSFSYLAGTIITALITALVPSILAVPFYLFTAISTGFSAIQAVLSSAGLFLSFAVYSSVWVLLRAVLPGRRVLAAAILWGFSFFYLLVSYKVLPGFNPFIVLGNQAAAPGRVFMPGDYFLKTIPFAVSAVTLNLAAAAAVFTYGPDKRKRKDE